MKESPVIARGAFAEFPLEAIEQPITARFESQAECFPDRIAVVSGAARLSYGELDDWARRISLLLLEARGDRQEPVALLFDQGAAAIAATLGALMIGKIYVPLDPSYPPAQLARIVDWVGARVVVTDSGHQPLADRLGLEGVRVVVVDRLGTTQDGTRPTLGVSADSIAYVFFTSGSTGEPKGVFDSHRNVLHNVLRYTNALKIGADDRLTLLQSCAFSGSVSSIFGALLNGATLFPFAFADEGPRRLGELLLRERLTMYHSVPALFRSLLIGGERFPEMRVIRLEGDRASSVDVELYRRHFDPACVLANGLGTTETGLCRQYLLDSASVVEPGILPVGYPVRDMEVMVVDDDGRAVEVGESGEIAVRSRYLALGYWGRADLTESAFRRDTGGGPERVYRTGDLGRLHGDGCLDYLTRKDFQLKVRGHRVDTADVESALIALPDVRDAVVTTRPGARGEAEVVGYVVPAGSSPLDAGALRAGLGDVLPPHLIPARFAQLQALPLDASGKVDRSSLPEPAKVVLERSEIGLGPRDALEQTVVEIVEQVLEVGPIGIDDRLDELGTDSLAVAVIAARIETETGRYLTPALFRHGATAATLAEAAREDQAPTGTVALNPRGTRPPLFLVQDLNGGLSRYADLIHHLDDDQPVWGLRSAHGSIEEQAASFLTEIRRIQPAGPYRLGGWCFGGVVAFELAHQLRAGGEDVALLALIGISAADFPGLVARRAWRRYRLVTGGGARARVRHHLSTATRMGMRDGTTYLLRTGVRLLARTWRGAARAGVSSPPPLQVDPLPIVSRNREAFARYVPAPYPGRVTLVLSREETAAYSTDPAADWQRLGRQGVDVIEIPGFHAAILTEPHVGELAHAFRDLLVETRGRVESSGGT